MNCSLKNATSLRIADLPNHQKPREKLFDYGPATLSDSELLAIFIGSGAKGFSAIELGLKLLHKYGSIGSLGSLDASQLTSEHGLGQAKASRLAAAFELGSRVAREQIQTEILDSPQCIHRHFSPQLQHLVHEQVLVASVDCRLRHLATHTISVGSVNESIAHPRDILRPVIARGAHGFILMHNHPSGDPTPSNADREVTRRVRDAAELMQLRLVDHLIIGRGLSGRQPWFSFREAGMLN